MTAVTIEEAQAHLAELIEKLPPGEELVIMREEKPVARLVGVSRERPPRVLGQGAGTLTIVSDDDEHLRDWEEYMP